MLTASVPMTFLPAVAGIGRQIDRGDDESVGTVQTDPPLTLEAEPGVGDRPQGVAG